MATAQYYGTGRRKTSTARVFLRKVAVTSRLMAGPLTSTLAAKWRV